MRQSKIFAKTRKEVPQDEISKNAILLIRAGFVHKEMSGVYTFLSLGLMVLENINRIIREEMLSLGAEEIQMTALQNKEIWQKTERWDDNAVDIWFKTKLKNDTEIGLGFTHEEAITNMLKDHVRSYKDLPLSIFQIQTKFRNEIRSKSGLMRGREFLMKDLYTFARDEKEHEILYNNVAEAYIKIFRRLGLGDLTYKTFASGGTFSKYSHEFQTLSLAGEDSIFVSKKKGIAINHEVMNDDVLRDLNIDRNELVEEKAVEVGNIFSLGTRFSNALNLSYRNEKGEEKPVIMGSYGIGPSRVMGTIAEIFSDEKGLIWPEEIAPFKVHLIYLPKEGDNRVKEKAEEIYHLLQSQKISVLYDDRELRPGEKFADADLIGLPWRIVISEKLVSGSNIEIKRRTENEAKIIKEEQLLELLNKKA